MVLSRKMMEPPLFLSADATGLKDGAVKLDGRYYFFDSYGVCQSGMIKFTSGGKTETVLLWSGSRRRPEYWTQYQCSWLRETRFTLSVPVLPALKRAAALTAWRMEFLYYNGLLVSAKEGSSYEPFKGFRSGLPGKWAGKVQTEEKSILLMEMLHTLLKMEKYLL